MKQTQLVLALGAMLAASMAFAANPASGTSASINTSNKIRHIKTTVETNPKDKDFNKAAINVVDIGVKPKNSKGVANNQPVAFAKIDRTANNFLIKAFAKSILGKDKNGVTVAQLYRMKGVVWDNIPKMPDHSHLGRLSYAKAGNLDVYFGDWANVPSGAKANTAGTNYTVFYSGTGRTTNLPTSGKATYAVKGINNHVKQGTAVLTGTLTADFGAKKLNGTMARSGLSIAINNAAINTKAASFKGTAKANNRLIGQTHGHFFGNRGAAIAGVAEFGRNHQFNTAFGGTKK
ncbi:MULTISPECIES: Slam-dependent surface lipoprotein [unclassified Neisseria]|uniref:Slam-dependent surface lipoprotein n=1 Tax=unclassified Neisseria TaxID=2623750 RepID=UPI00266553CB|nr:MULTISPECIES: Slam-dependent surface lipoprotein [unclassified Neisseria]MDO1509998.1 Slam-dependent surface lipoprotein [Neisseria sp. MVDL19-042950]MDO1516198.1 Slam-dependent surface lipoprotein [Neisseria sp. MVDL18-041461]MDO1563313.1 Slam-dependent surface lipoprotein [Neisseria sp. MVDL20-010259]